MPSSILILAHDGDPPFHDVCTQYVASLKEFNKITVAFLRKKAVIPGANEIVCFDLPKKALRFLKLRAFFKLLYFCRTHSFDVVVCHRYKPSYLMLLVAQFCQIKHLIFVMHELHTFKASGRQRLFSRVFKPNMLLAGVSNAVRDDLRKSLVKIPENQIQTLYNALALDDLLPYFLSKSVARDCLHLAQNAFIFCNMARLHPNKDQSTLLKAFALFKAHTALNKPCYLILIGAGEEEAALKQLAQDLGIIDDVLFLGYLSRGFQYLKAFDVFVLSSKQEAFGRVLLEAMSAALPIIATDVHGIPEVVDNAGIIVPCQDSIRLAEAMQQITQMDKNELEQLGKQGKDRVQNHFSIAAFQKSFLAMLADNNQRIGNNP